MATEPTRPAAEDLSAFALEKLTRVFGDARGARLYEDTLRELGAERLRDPHDLQAFARVLARRGGMEAAVGGLLGVAATVRGAGG